MLGQKQWKERFSHLDPGCPCIDLSPYILGKGKINEKKGGKRNTVDANHASRVIKDTKQETSALLSAK